MKILKKNITKLMMTVAICTNISIANASDINKENKDFMPQSEALLKMKRLMTSDDLYLMLASLNSSVPELSRAANQTSTIRFQNESLAEFKKMNTRIDVTNYLLIKALKEITELKKGASS